MRRLGPDVRFVGSRGSWLAIHTPTDRRLGAVEWNGRWWYAFTLDGRLVTDFATTRGEAADALLAHHRRMNP